MIFPLISSLFLIIAIVCLFHITPQQISDDLLRMTSKEVNLREKARSLRAGKRKKKTVGERLRYTQSSLAAMGKENRFAFVCCASLVLFAVGAVVAILIDNLFLIPVLSAAFSLIPFIYVSNTLSQYNKHIKGSLESTMQSITNSYIRNEDIVDAVRENLMYIRPPLNESFNEFIGVATSITADVRTALKNLKSKVDDDIFGEWVDMLILCQDDNTMRSTLQAFVDKLRDVRQVNAELNDMMAAVRMEYYTMVGLVVGNIPLLYLLNKDWFHTLIYETPGKIILSVCGVVILVTYMFLQKFTKPIDFKR